ncbi:unnamed protein product [Leptidea sinapis]|nr:unnamed protein product [Leptidea sinapis]
MAVEKLYESEDFLIVNKPFDMYINCDDENEKNTVTSHIAKHDSHMSISSNPLHFVHRLDYSTSGVLCIAKNRTAAAQAGRLFEKRQTHKYYLAVVRQHPDFELGDIYYDIGVDPSPEDRHKMRAVTQAPEQAAAPCTRSAQTRLLLLETGLYCEEPVAVVLLKPMTGNTTTTVPANTAHSCIVVGYDRSPAPAPRALLQRRPHDPGRLHIQPASGQCAAPHVPARRQTGATLTG